jgi:hypothetical protein
VVECWSAGVLELECWSAGVLECWSAGVLECWSAGVLECWSAGVLECWSAGVLVLILYPDRRLQVLDWVLSSFFSRLPKRAGELYFVVAGF